MQGTESLVDDLEQLAVVEGTEGELIKGVMLQPNQEGYLEIDK